MSDPAIIELLNRCQSAETELGHTRRRLRAAEKRAGELAFKLADDQFWKLKAEQAESECDSSQASLLRVTPVYDAAIAWCRCYLTEGGKSSENELREAIRTALSPHKET